MQLLGAFSGWGFNLWVKCMVANDVGGLQKLSSRGENTPFDCGEEVPSLLHLRTVMHVAFQDYKAIFISSLSSSIFDCVSFSSSGAQIQMITGRTGKS